MKPRLAGAAIGFWLLAVTPTAEAKVFLANKTGDPAEGACTRQHCTLREAILAANTRPGADVIELRAGKTYVMQQAEGDEDLGTGGDFDLTGPTTLHSSKPGKRATVDGQDIDRVFHSFAPVTVSGLKVTGGGVGGFLADGASLTLGRSVLAGNDGGGAAQIDAGSLAVSRSKANGNSNSGFSESGEGDVRLSRSKANGNGNNGIFEGGAGVVSAKRSTLSGNGNNGLIEIDAGAVRVSRSRVVGSGNNNVLELGDGDLTAIHLVAGGAGNGGVAEDDDGALRLSRSKVRGSGNIGVSKLGDGDVSISRSKIAGNDNGGFSSDDSNGTILISKSTFSGNTTGVSGGGIRFEGFGLIRIVGATISGNTASEQGGGIYNGGQSGSRLDLENSTVTGNRASNDGGGVFVGNAAGARLNNVTIARNTSNFDAGLVGAGGGLYLSPAITAEAEVANSLIALNDAVGDAGDDCSGGFFDSTGGNLLTDAGDCDGFDAPGDDVRPNPKIGQLAKNGGPTRTIALKRRSPAVGHARKASAKKRDQRGLKRDKDPDTGAFER